MITVRPSDFNRRNVSFGLLRLYKNAVQKTRNGRSEVPQTVVIIQGCQRSGTSLTYWIFERDINSRIYREASVLSSQDDARLRLNPLTEVQAEIVRHPVPLVVMKPLVESQRTLEILDSIEGSKALWLYRHYQDVAASNLKAFGMDNGINDLRPIVINASDNWRAQNTSATTRAEIRQLFSEDMNPYDAAALFWYARNQLFFEQKLDRDPRTMLCRYEDLVTRPAETMTRVYEFIGIPYPGDQIVQDVHPHSVGKGRESMLSTEVEALCAKLLDDLNGCQQEQFPVAVTS